MTHFLLATKGSVARGTGLGFWPRAQGLEPRILAEGYCVLGRGIIPRSADPRRVSDLKLRVRDVGGRSTCGSMGPFLMSPLQVP